MPNLGVRCLIGQGLIGKPIIIYCGKCENKWTDRQWTNYNRGTKKLDFPPPRAAA